MIPDQIQREILHRLHATEKQEDVKILMAIESGSRAWGFASPNSDYDVRFIYARDTDWYLSVDLEKKRDVIEYEIVDDIDLNGWDIKKALWLFWNSNPGFVEWIQSPITYLDTGCFRETALRLLPEIYSISKGIYHYRSMAKTNYRGYLQDDLVPLKKYFYVLRPLLAIKWLEEKQCAAPIEFDRLFEFVESASLFKEIEVLLERKKVAKEKKLVPRISVLNNFIESELNRLESFKPPEKMSVKPQSAY
jgi:predicted nucleotidyltransferase